MITKLLHLSIDTRGLLVAITNTEHSQESGSERQPEILSTKLSHLSIDTRRLLVAITNTEHSPESGSGRQPEIQSTAFCKTA